MTASPIFKSPAGQQAVTAFFDAIQAAWPVPYETRTIPTRHGDTHVIAAGDLANPPLILLHGSSSNAASWAGDVADYAAGYRVYAVDLIGDTGRSAPTRPDYEGPGYVEWLEDMCAALDATPATLVGLSLGGWVALKYAVAHPERVAALALLAPGGIVPPDVRVFLKMVPLFLLGKWGQRRAVQMLFADQPVPEDVVVGTTLIQRHFRPRRETLPIFTDAALASLTMPVLFVGGEKDRLFDAPATAARLAAQVPHVETRIIPGVGHAVVNTAPIVMRYLMGLRAADREPA